MLELKVSGDLACQNLHSDRSEIDWITRVEDRESRTQARSSKIADRLVMRGGRDFQAMSHYFFSRIEDLHLESHVVRARRQFRIDHSAFLNLVFGETSAPMEQALESIGYLPAEWRSVLPLPTLPGAKTVWMFSFWTDSHAYLYKHKTLDLVVPFHCEASGQYGGEDITLLPEDLVRGGMASEAHFRTYQALKADFHGIGLVSEESFHSALVKVMDAARGKAMVIIMLVPEYWRRAAGEPAIKTEMSRLNSWVRKAVAAEPHVHLVDMLDFESPGAARPEALHFDRLTYCRASEHIMSLIESKFAAGCAYR